MVSTIEGLHSTPSLLPRLAAAAPLLEAFIHRCCIAIATFDVQHGARWGRGGEGGEGDACVCVHLQMYVYATHLKQDTFQEKHEFLDCC